ncbi:MAG TPA: restriction endonuclease subunit S [Chthoniobacterales bacterium]
MKAGWEKIALGEVFTTVTGNTPSKSNSEFFGDFMPLVKPPELCDSTVDSAEDGLSEAGVEVARTVPPNSILVSCIGNLGKVALNTIPVAFNQQINAILPDENRAVPEFIFYQVLSCDFKDQLEALSSGTTVPIVNKSRFNSIGIVLPPLAEQQRIVGVLDEAFAGLATAKANAEKNLQNARALFESHLQSVFTHRDDDWVERRLGDVITRLTNGYVGPTRNIYQESGVPYLLARHVKDNRLLFDGRTFITEEFNRRNKKSMLKAGDVLLVQSGHIGHSAVVTPEHEGHNCHAMIVISSVEGAFIGPFLSLFFNSSGMKQRFQEIRSGSTVPHLTCGEVKELKVPLPDLDTQRRVVDRSLELERETQRLAAITERKLAALEALKKSLLHQAFSGAL